MGTALGMKVVEYTRGGITRFRITDPEHTHAGRSGQLEFTKEGRAWLQVGSELVAVKLDQLKPITTALKLVSGAEVACH